MMMNDFPDYTPDMDHDGEITGKDFALFHEMLDEDQKEEQDSHANTHRGSSEPFTKEVAIMKLVLLIIFGGYPALMFNGVIPINGFTAVLALVSIVLFLRTLLL